MSEFWMLTPDESNPRMGQLWEVEGDKAKRIQDMGGPVWGYPLPLQIKQGQTLLEAVRENAIPNDNKYIDMKETRCPMGRGYYHPRVYRLMAGRDPERFVNEAPPFPRDQRAFQSGQTQLDLLTRSLGCIFEFVSPDVKNFAAFGHEMRDQLIIACTEVEAQLKGILKANGILATGRDYRTEDYVKLKSPLRLADYEIGFTKFPGLGGFRPFSSWDATKPTKSLPWYDDYNATKHDREENFDKAHLLNVIYATLACQVVFAAQYGPKEIDFYYTMTRRPEWNVFEMYVAPESYPMVELPLPLT